MADLLHLQVVAPGDLAPHVVDYVEHLDSSLNIVVMVGAARRPTGDVVTFSVARESINDVLGGLTELGVVAEGAVTVFHTELALSEHADTVQERAPGDPNDTVIWDEVAAKLTQSVGVTLPFLAYFVVAAVIAAVGVLTDSPILIVGAMVVGPEYGSLASVAFGFHRRDLGLVRRGAGAFAVGTAVAVAAALLVSLLVRAVGQVPDVYTDGLRPLTEFITKPDLFTAIVAGAAGIAGMLALTQGRGDTLVGVLISVTTIPAIAEVGVGLAFGDGDEVTGALAQLGVNLSCLVAVGVATLVVLRRLSPVRRRPGPHAPVSGEVAVAPPD